MVRPVAARYPLIRWGPVLDLLQLALDEAGQAVDVDLSTTS
jgi:hypothetical protein